MRPICRIRKRGIKRVAFGILTRSEDRHALILVCSLAMLVAGCGSQGVSPTIPSPTPLPAPAAPTPATGSLTAFVRNDGGQPIENADVTALVGVSPFAHVKTAADGSLHLENLTLGAAVILRVTAVPYENSDTTFIVAEDNAVNITLRVLQQ